MAVELDPLPMGKDIQPILVGQASTRCHGDKDGCEKKYIAVAVVIFIVIVSIYIVITTRERVTEIMKDKKTESLSIYLSIHLSIYLYIYV